MQPVIGPRRRACANFIGMSDKAEFARVETTIVLCLALGTLLAGCAHHREFSGADQRAIAAPPSFLTGPMALLLTNANNFNAQVIFETRTSWGSTQMVTGSFTGAGSKLAFQPELPKSSRKNTQARMSFVWDTAQSSGYALNDALQGYALFSGTVRFTNVVVSKQNSTPERIGGHECEEENAIVFGSDGSTNLLQVWQATDLHGFPLRISGMTNSTTGILTFSKVQFGPPAEFLMPQEGFTKYDSLDAMVTELMARQHNLRRSGGETFGYPINIEGHQPRPGQPY